MSSVGVCVRPDTPLPQIFRLTTFTIYYIIQHKNTKNQRHRHSPFAMQKRRMNRTRRGRTNVITCTVKTTLACYLYEDNKFLEILIHIMGNSPPSQHSSIGRWTLALVGRCRSVRRSWWVQLIFVDIVYRHGTDTFTRSTWYTTHSVSQRLYQHYPQTPSVSFPLSPAAAVSLANGNV